MEGPVCTKMPPLVEKKIHGPSTAGTLSCVSQHERRPKQSQNVVVVIKADVCTGPLAAAPFLDLQRDEEQQAVDDNHASQHS